MMGNFGSWRSPRHGAIATEFAFVAPVLLLLAIACADFGRIPGHTHVVSNAARSGAETGGSKKFTDFTRPSWEADVKQSIENELANLPSFDPNRMEIDVSTTVDSSGLHVVTVEVMYPFMTSVAWPGIPRETNIRRRVVYRQFR
ncbi:TadE family protein [Blastopirellula marina]|nr:TadE family protein [Blastopirellula marina]